MSADDINWRNARRPILICSFGVREKTRMSIAVHGMCMDVLETAICSGEGRTGGGLLTFSRKSKLALSKVAQFLASVLPHRRKQCVSK